MPGFSGIDHVHVYVSDLPRAEQWYARTLGFSAVEALAAWNEGTGPLTMVDAGGGAHIALFESDRGPASTIAFGSDGEGFLAWLAHLEAQAVTVTVKDHELSWSMYFEDPFGNVHEITTYDCDRVSRELSGRGSASASA